MLMKPLFFLPPFSFPCKISFIDLAADFQASLCATALGQMMEKMDTILHLGSSLFSKVSFPNFSTSFGIVGRAAGLA